MTKILLSNPTTTPQIFQVKLQAEDTTSQSYEVPSGALFSVVGSAVQRPGQSEFETVGTPSLFTPHSSTSTAPAIIDSGAWYVVGAIVGYVFVRSCGKY